jgi:hypothetical protein
MNARNRESCRQLFKNWIQKFMILTPDLVLTYYSWKLNISKMRSRRAVYVWREDVRDSIATHGRLWNWYFIGVYAWGGKNDNPLGRKTTSAKRGMLQRLVQCTPFFIPRSHTLRLLPFHYCYVSRALQQLTGQPKLPSIKNHRNGPLFLWLTSVEKKHGNMAVFLCQFRWPPSWQTMIWCTSL